MLEHGLLSIVTSIGRANLPQSPLRTPGLVHLPLQSFCFFLEGLTVAHFQTQHTLSHGLEGRSIHLFLSQPTIQLFHHLGLGLMQALESLPILSFNGLSLANSDGLPLLKALSDLAIHHGMIGKRHG